MIMYAFIVFLTFYINIQSVLIVGAQDVKCATRNIRILFSHIYIVMIILNMIYIVNRV